MGMQNLIPGTGLLLEKRDSSHDATEILGPVGDMAKRFFQAIGELASGEVGKAVELASTRAVTDAVGFCQAFKFQGSPVGYRPEFAAGQ